MRLYPVCAVALLAAVATSARAEDTKPQREGQPAEEPRGQVNLELMVGAGQVEALDPAATAFFGQLRYERAPTDVTATAIVLSGLYDFTPHVALGLRLPLAIAELRPEGDADRSTANLGNLEVEAELKTEARPGIELFAAAHLALPTSSGDELPSEQALAGSQAGIDPVAADKYSVNKAIASAYGYENNAMWLAGYLGVVPVLGAKLRFGRLRIEPYVKSEMMFSVRSQAQERAIVEIDAGGRVALGVTPWLDVALHAWASLTVTDHEGDPDVGVIEPEVRVGRERWRVTAGLLVPFAGELTAPEWISGRLSASVLF